MLRLTGAEFYKVWGKRGFLMSCCALLLLNLFLLWYTTLPGETRPGLSAWKKFQQIITEMTEQEKGVYIGERKEMMDGIGFVEEVLMMQGMSDEMGEAMADQARENNPGVFEQYYELYQSGDYLLLTDSVWQERNLTEELYAEWEKCAGYGEYLQSVQEKSSTMSSISIFSEANKTSFSARNVQKSASDYGKLSAEGLNWMPDRAVTGAMENIWTDFLLLLSVFLFVSNLILEEKEKQLFYIVRSTKRGMGVSIGSRLAALVLHCGVMVLTLYGINLVYFGGTVGYGDLSAKLQSLAAYRESALSISIRGYILLSLVTKCTVLFGFGALLTALCIAAGRIFLPYVGGIGLMGGSYFLYTIISPVSRANLLKYFNLFGIMKTENLYGAYLNFNLFGYPVSRLALSWILIGLIAGTGMIFSVFIYWKGENLVIRLWRGISLFRPQGSLFWHEWHKLLISNPGLVILLLFGFLAGYQEWNHSYIPSPQERYYQDLMRQLEGELTAEKEDLVWKEQNRYQEAFDRISQIDRMVSEGELSERAGEDMKMKYYAVTAFYPAFARVWQQYQNSKEKGGQFVYDTGYLYLAGKLGENTLTDLLLLCCGSILAFSGASSMEDARGTWYLLGSTQKGKGAVLHSKLAVCMTGAFLLFLIPLSCRAFRVSEAFPLEGFTCCIRDIPAWGSFLVPLPLWSFLIVLGLSQGLIGAGISAVVFVCSCWRKDTVQACLFTVLFLVLPLVMTVLGFQAAEKISLYPLYNWLARL